MKSFTNVVGLGGICLAGGALAFLVVFSYLAANFNYPEVLDGPAATVLPSLLGTGSRGRLVWTIYAFLPLIWIPAGVGAFEALAPVRRGAMRLALCFAIVASIAMMLGLNTYLGNFIGEFLGELAVSMFFLLTSFVWLRSTQRARWVGWIGVVTGVAGLIGMFRNVSSIVAPIAEVNNYLLPLFMVVLGIALIRWRTAHTGSIS